MNSHAGYDHVGAIMAFESGELDQEGTVRLFQYLLDTGLAWELQGYYGRATLALLDAGEIHYRPNLDARMALGLPATSFRERREIRAALPKGGRS